MTPSATGRLKCCATRWRRWRIAGARRCAALRQNLRATGRSRTPGEILAHICDLFDWALTLADGKQAWHNSKPQAWEADAARFFALLEAFDRRLASGVPLSGTRAAVSGSGGGRVDARGTDRDAAADGGMRDERRELFRGED